MDIQKLFEIQAGLDFHINKEHPIKDGENRFAKKILALQVELGELANEWRGFKFWSNNREPRLKGYKEIKCKWCNGSGDDGTGICPDCKSSGDVYKEYNPLLEEYVDCLHFILSIGLELNFTDIDVWKVKETTTTNQFIECFGIIYDIHFQKTVNGEVPRVMYEHLFAYFIGLGEMLGFTWEQIEQTYLEKNRINHERQEVGY